MCVCVCVSECAHMLRRINNVSEKLSRHNNIDIIDSTQLRWVPYRPTDRQSLLQRSFAPKKIKFIGRGRTFLEANFLINKLFK